MDKNKQRIAADNRLAEWFGSSLPVQALVTMTMPIVSRVSVSQERINTAFDGFWWDFQRSQGRRMGFLRADELDTQRHIHLAIVSPEPIHDFRVQTCWARACEDWSPERTHIDHIDPEDPWSFEGLSYLMKRGDWVASSNITLFQRGRDLSSMKAAERRRYLQIYPDARTAASPLSGLAIAA